MTNLFSDATRRNPFPAYDHLRASSPLLQDPHTGLYLVFDYPTVNHVLTDHETFSSRNGPPEWMIFQDPPRHPKLRALISKAFTPRSITSLEPRIRQIAQDLLARVIPQGQMDLAADFAVPLPMMVIAEMLGIPHDDRPRFIRWNDAILEMSYTIPAGKEPGPEALAALHQFAAATEEMDQYLATLLDQRRTHPRDDLLTRLTQSEIDGERLHHKDILGFFQLLLLAGSETTTNLINNTVLCLLDHSDQLNRLRASPDLLPSAIEETLRFRSPIQWMFRFTTKDVELHNQTIPARKVILAVIGSANRDPQTFPNPNHFDITRHPNPHLAFGHGSHFCLGAPLARLESKIALTEFLSQIPSFTRTGDPNWQPRRALHIHGPQSLPLRL